MAITWCKGSDVQFVGEETREVKKLDQGRVWPVCEYITNENLQAIQMQSL